MSEYFIPEELIDFVSSNEIEDDHYSDQLQYRSLAVVPEFSDYFNHSSIDIPHQPLFRSATSNNSPCGGKPMILSRTHFTIESAKANDLCGTDMDVFTTMTRTITAYLSCFVNEYDFSFITPKNASPLWKGKYIQGSVSCDIDINIYTGDSPESFIVEASRMKGDSKPFHTFYREFKSLVLNTKEEGLSSLVFSSLPVAKVLSKEQFLHSVRCIFNMATAKYVDSRVEATKMLCDLLSQPHNQYLQLPEFSTACVNHLEALIVDDFDDVRQFAIIAFASLKDIPGYQEKLVRSKALPLIFSMVEFVPEPMYETIQVRRECARLLAALAQFEPRAVMENLQSSDKKVVQDWKLEKLACDATLHNFAATARDSLLKIVMEKK